MNKFPLQIKVNLQQWIYLGVVIIGTVSIFVSNTFAFHRSDSASYADRWWSKDDSDDGRKYNPNYHDYTNEGGDCANYVSQCLRDNDAGGLNLSAGPGVDDWGCIPLCENLHTHLINNQYVEYSFISNNGSPPDNLTTGDVIIFGGYNPNDSYEHAVIVVGGSGNSCIVDSHTTDHQNIRWNYGFPNYWTEARFYHIPDARVTSTTPDNESTGAGIDTNIVINFSKPMDITSVENAFSIYPDIQGEFSWSNNNRTLTFTP
ncbi:MAG: amidase domain-containing protein, partial [bacterium]